MGLIMLIHAQGYISKSQKNFLIKYLNTPACAGEQLSQRRFENLFENGEKKALAAVDFIIEKYLELNKLANGFDRGFTEFNRRAKSLIDDWLERTNPEYRKFFGPPELENQKGQMDLF